MTPTWSERYQRQPDLDYLPPHMTLDPMETNYARPAIPGWEEYIHPEGIPYYFNPEKYIVTDSDMRNDETRQDIEEFYEQVLRAAEAKGYQIPKESHLILEMMPNQAGTMIVCGYYFVDVPSRCLFWLQEFEADYLARDIMGPMEKHHFSKHDVPLASIGSLKVLQSI